MLLIIYNTESHLTNRHIISVFEIMRFMTIIKKKMNDKWLENLRGLWNQIPRQVVTGSTGGAGVGFIITG